MIKLIMIREIDHLVWGGMQMQIQYPKTTAIGMQKVAMKAVRRESCNAMLILKGGVFALAPHLFFPRGGHHDRSAFDNKMYEQSRV